MSGKLLGLSQKLKVLESTTMSNKPLVKKKCLSDSNFNLINVCSLQAGDQLTIWGHKGMKNQGEMILLRLMRKKKYFVSFLFCTIAPL